MHVAPALPPDPTYSVQNRGGKLLTKILKKVIDISIFTSYYRGSF